MFKAIKNNLAITITIIFWIIFASIFLFVFRSRLSQITAPPPLTQESFDVNPTHVDQAVKFSLETRLTASNSSDTLESSESAQDQ